MPPDDLARLIEELILKADAIFARNMVRVQSALYEDLLSVLKNLETEDGYILQNSNNRNILSLAEEKVSEVFSGALYQASVSSYVAVIPRIDELNQQYFSTFKGFKENKQFLKSLQKTAIKNVETYLLQDGLQAQVISPLSNVLNVNVNTGGRFSGFLKQVQDFVQGNENVDGRALSYSRNFLKDTLMIYARSFQQSITDDLGLNYYLYSGGLIDTSRAFCIERAGKYYSHKEVESWASLSWSGKRSDTTESSIFVYCGGHGCTHQLIPVDDLLVDEETKNRAKR